jgi:hypothetical protein
LFSDVDEIGDSQWMKRPESFEEFWPYYVSQHQDPTCRKLHFVGTTLAMGCLALAPAYPWMAVAAPIAGYGFAWAGHFVFEKNKPASWGGAKAAYWSLRGDLRMWMYMLEGTMDAEVERYSLSAAVAS